VGGGAVAPIKKNNFFCAMLTNVIRYQWGTEGVSRRQTNKIIFEIEPLPFRDWTNIKGTGGPRFAYS
jgi:hypothetical protein